MDVGQRIDDLIEAGWGVSDSDFDPVAFLHWRRKAFDCLTALVGPDHVYTRHFENFVRQGRKTDILAAGGILSAAKEQMACNWAERQSRWQREVVPRLKKSEAPSIGES
jgi:hypothetical protein